MYTLVFCFKMFEFRAGAFTHKEKRKEDTHTWWCGMGKQIGHTAEEYIFFSRFWQRAAIVGRPYGHVYYAIGHICGYTYSKSIGLLTSVIYHRPSVGVKDKTEKKMRLPTFWWKEFLESNSQSLLCGAIILIHTKEILPLARFLPSHSHDRSTPFSPNH